MQTQTQLKNLKPFTKDTAKENGRKGGVASGIKRNQDKTFRQLIKKLSRQAITDEEAIKELESVGLDADFRSHILLSVYKQATEKGNYQAQAKLLELFNANDTDISDSFNDAL